MEDEVKRLEIECNRLRETIGCWRRMAQEKAPRRKELIKEGYNKLYKEHYKVFVLDHIPTDLDIKSVINEIEVTFIPTVEPYKFRRVDYSTKHKSWLVEVVAKLEYTKLANPVQMNWYKY